MFGLEKFKIQIHITLCFEFICICNIYLEVVMDTEFFWSSQDARHGFPSTWLYWPIFPRTRFMHFSDKFSNTKIWINGSYVLQYNDLFIFCKYLAYIIEYVLPWRRINISLVYWTVTKQCSLYFLFLKYFLDFFLTGDNLFTPEVAVKLLNRRKSWGEKLLVMNYFVRRSVSK